MRMNRVSLHRKDAALTTSSLSTSRIQRHYETPLGSLNSQLIKFSCAACFVTPDFPVGWRSAIQDFLHERGLVPTWMLEWFEQKAAHIVSAALRKPLTPSAPLLLARLDERESTHPKVRDVYGLLCLSDAATILVEPEGNLPLSIPAREGLLLLFQKETPYSLRVQPGRHFYMALLRFTEE